MTDLGAGFACSFCGYTEKLHKIKVQSLGKEIDPYNYDQLMDCVNEIFGKLEIFCQHNQLNALIPILRSINEALFLQSLAMNLIRSLPEALKLSHITYASKFEKLCEVLNIKFDKKGDLEKK